MKSLHNDSALTMLIVFIFILNIASNYCIISAHGESGKRDIRKDYLAYTDKEEGIKIEYPKNWTHTTFLNQGISPLTKTITFYPITERYSQQAGLSITIERMLSNFTLREYAGAKYENLKLLFSVVDFKEIYLSNTTISGKPAWILAFSASDPYSEESRIGIIAWAIRGNSAYEISYIANNKVFFTHLPVALQILDSFEFID